MTTLLSTLGRTSGEKKMKAKTDDMTDSSPMKKKSSIQIERLYRQIRLQQNEINPKKSLWARIKSLFQLG
jgi:hypothetical protein